METTNNSQNNMQELENLRQQVSEFKERLDEQQIVNDRLMRNSMKSNVSWFKQTNVWICIIGTLFLPFIIFTLRVTLGVQWLPIIVFCVIFLLDVIFNFWQIRSISASMFAKCDMLTVRRKMIDFKRREKLQMLIEVPLLILWGVWAFMTSNVEGDFAQIIGYSFIFGALLGLALAFGIFFFEMRSVNKTIRELDDYTNNQ